MPLSLHLNPNPLKTKARLVDSIFQGISKTPFHSQLEEFQSSTEFSDQVGLSEKIIKLSELGQKAEKLLAR